MNRIVTLCYFLFLVGVAFVSYRNPIKDDFDRYVYEAITRQRSEPLVQVHSSLRQSYPRAAVSEIIDTPEHLAQLEPMYAVKPLYLEIIGSLYYKLGFPPQSAINLVSASSMLIVGVILFYWLKQPLLTGLVMLTPAALQLARLGTPDALSAVFTIGACCALAKARTTTAIFLLIPAIFVRTDNVILAIVAIAWLTWIEKSLTTTYAIALAAIAIASVGLINHFSGNYGWVILFRHSFFQGGGFPAQIQPRLSAKEYLRVFFTGCSTVLPHFAVWGMLGIVAWKRISKRYRYLMFIAGSSILIHFLLLPSGEERYYVWGYLVIAAVFIDSLTVTDKLPVKDSLSQMAHSSPQI
jgi:hypothetical protein